MKKICLILCTLILVAASFVSCKNDPTKMTDVTVKDYLFDCYVVTGTIKETYVDTQNTNVTTTTTTYTLNAPEGNTDKTINNGFVFYEEDKSTHGNFDKTVYVAVYNIFASVDDAASTSIDHAQIGDDIEIYDRDYSDLDSGKANICILELAKIDGDYYFRPEGGYAGYVKVDVDEDALEDGESFTLSFTEKFVATTSQPSGSTNVNKQETTVEVNLTFTAQ